MYGPAGTCHGLHTGVLATVVGCCKDGRSTAKEAGRQLHMSYSLNSLRGIIWGV